jgi:hypothetical protein
MTGTSPSLPAGHVLVPALTVGCLSVLLSVGLHVLGILDRLHQRAAQWLGGGDFSKSLPPAVEWLAAVLVAFFLSFSILSVSGSWRRFILWVTTLVLLAGWAPVLFLADHAPVVGGPIIAAAWSGICAMVYASRHVMDCDAAASKVPTRGISDEAH